MMTGLIQAEIASYNKCLLASGVQFNVTIGNLCDVSQAELMYTCKARHWEEGQL